MWMVAGHNMELTLSESVVSEIGLPNRLLKRLLEYGMGPLKISASIVFPDCEFIPYGPHPAECVGDREGASKTVA